MSNYEVKENKALKARNIILHKMAEINVSCKVSAQTVGFSDLARGSSVFVTLHGWAGTPEQFRILKNEAHEHGFSLDA